MDNNKYFSLPSDWVQRKLIVLQRELKTSGKWPEPANQLWLDLAQNKQAHDKEADDPMFSIVVSDALDGIDITKKHPKYYRRMLQNPELFQAFLEVIEALEADEAPQVAFVPEIQLPSLGVMNVAPEPVFERPTSGGWLVRWQQSVAQLNVIFNVLGPNLALNMRSTRGLLEESVAPLIRSEVTVEEKTIGVRLSAVLADDPDALDLRLTVALLDDDSADFSLKSLRADIQWGDYQQMQAINDLGQATFPPLPIKAITDETGETIKNDLHLLIHPAP